MQQLEQRAAPDAEAMRLWMQIGVAEVEHAAAAARPGFQADDLGPQAEGGVTQAERAQHRKAGRLKQEPRS